MPAANFDMARLVEPIGVETFLGEYWEKQPLVIPRGDPGHYAGLLSTADVDRVIAFTRPKFADQGALRKDARREETYVQGWLADRLGLEGTSFPGITELHEVYSRGKTLVIMTMQQRWSPVAVLCRNLESTFRCPVHANMYLTPGGAQGFDVHFDTHEVLVLQLEGSKHWRLFGCPRPFPLVGERFEVPRDQRGEPRDIHLEAGDLLYIPRGYLHEAFTSECASLHLTVGVNVIRWADLLHEAIDQATRNDESFRESVPAGVLAGKDLEGSPAGRFRRLLEDLSRHARLGDAVRNLDDRFFSQLQPLPDARFLPPEPVAILDRDTVLERSPGAICRVVQDGGWVTIEFPGGKIGGPSKIAAALGFVAKTARFPVRDLPEGLGAEGKLVLARRLVRERLLRVAVPDATGT